MDVLIGMLIGAFCAWLLWDAWKFQWTAKHNLRADLFEMTREEVYEELAYVVRHSPRQQTSQDQP